MYFPGLPPLYLGLNSDLKKVRHLRVPNSKESEAHGPGGPADIAGIRGDSTNMTVNIEGEEIGIGGDIIVAIDGQEVRNLQDIVTYLESEKEAGESVSLSVHGLDSPREVKVELGTIYNLS
jgi:S1-C subfamily serine protease